MAIRVLFHGHSNLEIHTGTHRIQIDPFYTSNPLADVKADAVNPAHILLSHAHFDHVEDAEALAKRTGAVIASNYEITEYYARRGVKNIRGMNHGGAAALAPGLRVTYTIAFHTSSFPDGTYGGQPGGWIAELGEGPARRTIYFAGDTALFGDMAMIGELWSIDLACLPIGDNFTMGPDHAIRAARMLKAKRVLPMHYNTFPAIQQDPQAFVAELSDRTGIKGLPLQAGESIEL